MENNIYGVYFVGCLNNYFEVVQEQISILIECGLYNRTKKFLIFVCMYNEIKDKNFYDYIKNIDIHNKIELIITPLNLYEKFAINNYKHYIKDKLYYMYYFHTKGVSRYGTDLEDMTTRVRKNLNVFILKNYERNIEILSYYDVVGCNLTLYPKKHFSGNFWWSKSSYINTLPDKINNGYLSPEMYVCSNDNGLFISVSNSANDLNNEKVEEQFKNKIETLSLNYIVFEEAKTLLFLC
jgi:hypothetical protein